MKKIAALVVAFAPLAALAQGFVDEPTCYSWTGGDKSAGAFAKCGPRWEVAKAPPAPPTTPVVATPVLQSTVCPPQVILQPEPQKAKPKPRPRPKPQTC